MHEEAVQPLRVLRALAPALADHRAHHQRHAAPAAVHVAALGGDVDELVHRQHQEVHADVDVDRPQPARAPADGGAGHGVLRQRRAEDALGAVLLDQPARRALDRLGVVHVQAEQDDRRIAGHLLVGRLADGIDVGQLALFVSLVIDVCVKLRCTWARGFVPRNRRRL